MSSTTFACASLQWADAAVDSVHFSKCMIMQQVHALLQVREVANLFTKGLEEAEAAENFCARTSLLYVPLLLSVIHFPHEPDFGFTVEDWHKVYPNLSDLIVDVVRLQIWGLWTIVALHCFVAAQGKHKSPEDQRRLPPFPGALLTIGESVMEAWCNDGYSQAPPPSFAYIPIMVGSEMLALSAKKQGRDYMLQHEMIIEGTAIQKKAEEEENATLAVVPYTHQDLPSPPLSPSLSVSDSPAPATPPTELDEEEEYTSAEE
ncbi:hypothetical protein FRC07_014329, partial [Ceratobasidium sp. 392]